MRASNTKRVVAISILGLVALGVSAADVAAQPQITSLQSVLPAGPDFATDVLGNPWDFSDERDLSPYPYEFGGWTITNTLARTVGRRAFLNNGRFTARTDASGHNTLPLLYPGAVDVVNSLREHTGLFDHHAIPTGQYGKLAIAMTLSATPPGPLAAFWYTTPYSGTPQGSRGLRFGDPKAGTRIYVVDLQSGNWIDSTGTINPGVFFPFVGIEAPWTAVPLMRGFQIRPAVGGANIDVQIDWVRVTQRDGEPGAAIFPLTFEGCSGQPYSVETQTGDTWSALHAGTATTAPSTTAQVNFGVLAPGTWNVWVTCYPAGRSNPGVSSQPRSITINAPPIVTVMNPDVTGGGDFATEVIGNPWDMNDVSDVRQYFGVGAPSVVQDGEHLSIQASSPPGMDPALVFVYGTPQIDTSRYRMLTFTLTLDTPFELAAPGGSVARIFWERPSPTGGNAVTTTQDILVWPGKNTYTVDLAQLTAENGGLETECPPSECARQPWFLGPVRYFRIDPHEDARGIQFRMGPVLLTAPDEVALGSQFPIQYSFTDADAGPGTYRARIYGATSRTGGSRVLLDTVDAGVVPNTPLTYMFDPAAKGVPPGEYYIYVEIEELRGDATVARGVFSGGTLRVTTGVTGPLPPGAPALVPVQTGANPVTVRWSPGPGGPPTSYTIAVGTSPGTSNVLVANLGLQTQVTADAPPGVPLYVRVVASNPLGSATSNEIVVLVPGPTPPAQPALAPATISGRTVTLAWSPGAGAPPTHYVHVARLPGNPQPIVTFPTQQPGLVVPNVPPGTYIVSVVAVNAVGASPESPPIQVIVP